uniref:Uncharacterized protein n=1 Tax=Picea glauca TaxID=3330 RepID=A0A117NH20_PICGL|nr:hypothetical protein ABT39_MTgene5819 [Picea glauca]QHR92303.1 hypothetical protein Q903MT_gene6345 [Picea sitchensis]
MQSYPTMIDDWLIKTTLWSYLTPRLHFMMSRESVCQSVSFTTNLLPPVSPLSKVRPERDGDS